MPCEVGRCNAGWKIKQLPQCLGDEAAKCSVGRRRNNAGDETQNHRGVRGLISSSWEGLHVWGGNNDEGSDAETQGGIQGSVFPDAVEGRME